MKEVQKQSGGTAERQIISLSQDSFYRELSREEIAQAESGTFNFDHPGGKCLFESRRQGNKDQESFIVFCFVEIRSSFWTEGFFPFEGHCLVHCFIR